ncbi:Nn.00g070870.m01.CDS01 [Neocucurbitaria sp. VM-36]
MSLLPNFKTIKDYVWGSPEQPPAPGRGKRRASFDSSRKTKYPRYDVPYSPVDYQKASYAGSATMTTTDEDTDEDRSRAGPSRPRSKPRSLNTMLREPKKPSSPTKVASPDKIRKAAEARRLLAKAYAKYQSIGDSEAERLAASIERLDPRAETIAEHLAEAVPTGKGKQPAKPIREFQPSIDIFSGSESGQEFSNGSTYTPPPARTPLFSPVKPMTTKAHKMQYTAPDTAADVVEKPEGWDELTEQKKWEAKPNLRARELVADDPIRAKAAIQKEVKESEYALRDAEIRDGLWQIMDQIERFAKKFFEFEYLPKDGVVPKEWYKGLTTQTAKVIGCVASGGPAGVHGWHELFVSEQKRRVLVCAIIGNVLVEQVLQHIFFGGSAMDITAISILQEKYRNEDGFDRNKHYAIAIRKILMPDDYSEVLMLPDNFNDHVNHIVGAIWTHLAPIFRLDPQNAVTSGAASIPDDVFARLHKLITQAGLLSLHMRIDPHTVYYFEPVFKEDNFTSQRMECFNFRDMQQRHPRYTAEEILALGTAEQERRAKLSDAEKKRSKNDDPLTQITVMDGVCAYRLGGWEKPDSTVIEPRYEKSEYKRQGVRQRILTHGWVYCRWGRAPRFKDGKPSDDEKIHGDAWKGGFVQFTDVEGVPDWLTIEREVKKKATEEPRKG